MQVSIEKISEFIHDMIIEPRLKGLKWSRITKQTPHVKAGYSGQHLASLITGIEEKAQEQEVMICRMEARLRHVPELINWIHVRSASHQC